MQLYQFPTSTLDYVTQLSHFELYSMPGYEATHYAKEPAVYETATSKIEALCEGLHKARRNLPLPHMRNLAEAEILHVEKLLADEFAGLENYRKIVEPTEDTGGVAKSFQGSPTGSAINHGYTYYFLSDFVSRRIALAKAAEWASHRFGVDPIEFNFHPAPRLAFLNYEVPFTVGLAGVSALLGGALYWASRT
jgi:hypothetical protein